MTEEEVRALLRGMQVDIYRCVAEEIRRAVDASAMDNSTLEYVVQRLERRARLIEEGIDPNDSYACWNHDGS